MGNAASIGVQVDAGINCIPTSVIGAKFCNGAEICVEAELIDGGDGPDKIRAGVAVQGVNNITCGNGLVAFKANGRTPNPTADFGFEIAEKTINENLIKQSENNAT